MRVLAIATYTYACIVGVANQSNRAEQDESKRIETGARHRPWGLDEAFVVMVLHMRVIVSHSQIVFYF